MKYDLASGFRACLCCIWLLPHERRAARHQFHVQSQGPKWQASWADSYAKTLCSEKLQQELVSVTRVPQHLDFHVRNIWVCRSEDPKRWVRLVDDDFRTCFESVSGPCICSSHVALCSSILQTVQPIARSKVTGVLSRFLCKNFMFWKTAARACFSDPCASTSWFSCTEYLSLPVRRSQTLGSSCGWWL